jgi:DNA-binding LytR/AlgR family response regulator
MNPANRLTNETDPHKRHKPTMIHTIGLFPRKRPDIIGYLKSTNLIVMVQHAHLTNKMVVNSGRKMYFIDIEKINYIEACNYYALICTTEKTYVVRHTLDEFEQRLSGYSFLRIHRSVILNPNIFHCIERENNVAVVRTTIGRDFKISRYRQKHIRDTVQHAF